MSSRPKANKENSFAIFKGCIRKRKLTKEAAITEAERLTAVGEGYKLDIYPCDGHWHVGHSRHNAKGEAFKKYSLLDRCQSCGGRLLRLTAKNHICQKGGSTMKPFDSELKKHVARQLPPKLPDAPKEES